MGSAASIKSPDTLHSGNLSTDISIISSSEKLGWQGIRVDRAVVRNLVADNYALPVHAFALATGQSYKWESLENGRFTKIISMPGNISTFPANSACSQRFEGFKEFIYATIEPELLYSMESGSKPGFTVEFKSDNNIDDPQLRGILTALAAEAEAGGPNGKMFVEALVQAFSIHYLTNYAKGSFKNERIPDLEQKQFSRAIEFMNSHLSENISIDQVAKAAGMSKFHFSRRFKERVGQTPYQYLLKTRTEKAKVLLKKGFSISEVAHHLGFTDQSHFGRIFLRNVGVSPGLFLRN